MLVLSSASSAQKQQLFNGKDLTGWQHIGFGEIKVEQGLLRTYGGVGLLWYADEKIGNSIVRIVYKVNAKDDNSGVFIRIPDAPEDPFMAVKKGLEVQINDAGNEDYHRTGSIYTFSKVKSRPNKLGEWNTMDITLDGAHTIVHINDVFVTEYTEGDPVPPRKNKWDPEQVKHPDLGYIGLQNHPQGKTVYFKEISIHPLE